MTEGTVVSQRRWAPADEADFRRHVEGVTLQLPVFFVNRHGGIGFGLPDILEGNDQDLNNRDSEAPLGGRTTTFLRINWPGYRDWSRQIPAQDQTQARRPITLARFMRHVGKSVDNFLNWEIGGEHGILQRDVKIIGAVHVSAGSWMPIIQLTRYVF
ncbi:hypothetical protein BC827DRAFT_1123100 [Russula dissimulans]|nr:hypothetical protein BC827DRAFT_1123100 [Russula dissimulans]